MIDNRTANLNLPLPHVDNALSDDVARLRTALTSVDAAIAGKQATLAYTPVSASLVGAANGIAPLDASGRVASTYLPSFVDDVLEFASSASLPAIGESGKIYVTTDANKTWRWSGTVYVEITAAPGSTSAIPEGGSNLYFTGARVLATVLTGLSTATNIAISAGDSVLSAFGKLQKQITDLVATVAGKQASLVSGTNIKTVGGVSLLGSGDISISLPVVVVAGTSQTAVAGNHYILTNAAATTVALPAGTSGAIVAITTTGTLTANVVTPAGSETIMETAGSMTIDKSQATVELRFINSTWRLI